MKTYIKSLALTLLLSSSTFLATAQQSATIAFDPLTSLMLGGYEVEMGYNFGQNRSTISYQSGGLSPWFGQAEDFKDASHSVLEIAYSRFLSKEQKGFSFGLAYAYYTDFTVENSLGQELDKNPSKVALKLGYAWFPFQTIPLYLEPVMTFGFMLNDDDLVFTSGEIFDKKGFIGNGPLFNVGYKFEF